MATILVVDDESNIIKTMTGILQDEGRVHSSADGKGALDFLRANQVDLVSSTCGFPTSTGSRCSGASNR